VDIFEELADIQKQQTGHRFHLQPYLWNSIHRDYEGGKLACLILISCHRHNIPRLIYFPCPEQDELQRADYFRLNKKIYTIQDFNTFQRFSIKIHKL
jgi:hypothetical protein